MTTGREAQVEFPVRTIDSYLDDTVKGYAHRPAIYFMGKTTSYGELGALVERAAGSLQTMGVKKGDKVGLCLPNTPYYTIFYFAVLKIGGVIVNFNPLYVEREIAFQARDSGARIMVTMDLSVIYDKVETVRQEGALDKVIVCPMADILPQPKKLLFKLFKRKNVAKIPADSAHVKFDALLALFKGVTPVEISPKEDIAVLQYTGGTTGVPKGAMLTHYNITSNMEMLESHYGGLKRGYERTLCVLPFFHVFAMTVLQNLSVLGAAEMLMMPRFDLKELLDLAGKKQPTLFAAVPTIYTAINNSEMTKDYDLTSIRYCMSGGAPLPVEVKQKFEALTGCVLVEGYGLTESSPVATANPMDGTGKDGSIGVLMPGTTLEFRDLEDLEKIVEKGQKGEVCIIGPQVMKGYWNRPDETAKTLEDGRILHTGDVGYMDEDGFIFLVDRIKDLIICSGYNVYPRVIEEALYQHPAVAEVIVIAIPDGYRGQAPKAFVKLKDGESSTEKDLKDFLKGHISKIEMPKSIEFRDELPKTMVGKLSKKELVEEEASKSRNSERI
ncbi:long-chain fatty acid--CoA ligase [Pseudovibrio sp. Tun.PSC04-5.I4]|uniref:long-chain-fatty-acid--CoA ligase n=1 Tax=Pseudovibrio sp. Tun.PSC04-5.I4 TaxID=1798213 RepID=UPI00087E6AC9|nr:long-chain fatty acid--CoA ligase [Pseudovibrio sp. Tun.PSC04-5.I4]SDR36635.1 long-chain acyl-CoA synthetase [Pseudovibrio sp. Tun.PSC04-5.I4]